MAKQIIAIGGGGFVHASKPSSLERYLLAQTGKKQPSVCFIPTASGDAAQYIKNFYDAFDNFPCQKSHLSLFHLPTNDIEGFLLEKDLLYIGGGNTKSMLALWREWQIPTYLKKAYEKGIVLAGSSAGGNCWFESCVTDSLYGKLTPLPCLGFLKGSFCPHYITEKERRPSYQALVGEKKLEAGLALDDHVAAHYVDGSLKQIVSASPRGSAYYVSKEKSGAKEEPLEILFL
ncbi:MAG: peptidase E [Verrucomicrobia bacterium]|nr:peptidase E [Verrucomicrobiota bacterium]